MDKEKILKMFEDYLSERGLKQSTIKLYLSYASAYLNENKVEKKENLKPFIDFLSMRNISLDEIERENDREENITKLIEKFLYHEKTTKNLKIESIRKEKSVLKKLSNFLEEKNVREIERVNSRILSDFFIQRMTDGVKSSTRNSELTIVKRFFKFLFKENIIPKDMGKDIVRPKLEKKLYNVLSFKEIKRLLDSIDRTTEDGLRDYALILFLYATGIRANEVINVCWSDVNFDEKLLRIHSSKEKEDRVVPIAEVALEALNQWKEKQTKESDKVFPLPLHKISRIVRKRAKEAGFRKRIIPHSFRHACATHMLENGAGIRYVQKMLGHKKISSTEIYTHINPTKLKSIITKFHPRG